MPPTRVKVHVSKLAAQVMAKITKSSILGESLMRLNQNGTL